MKVGDYVAVHPPWIGRVRCGIVIEITEDGVMQNRTIRTPIAANRFVSVRLDSGEVFQAVESFVDVISEK